MFIFVIDHRDEVLAICHQNVQRNDAADTVKVRRLNWFDGMRFDCCLVLRDVDRCCFDDVKACRG